MRWFAYCFGAMFVYYWFPNYIIQAMSYFNWMTWIAPGNVNLAAVTGGLGGLGLNPLPTWDWNQFTVTAEPLISPFYSIFNGFLGALVTVPIILAIWYTNTWNTAYIPINDSRTSPPRRLGEIVKSSTFGNDHRRITKILWVGGSRGIRALLSTHKGALRRIVV
jgi:hypothetical protein